MTQVKLKTCFLILCFIFLFIYFFADVLLHLYQVVVGFIIGVQRGQRG